MDVTVESAEAAKEPAKLMTVSMHQDFFKQAITQHSLSVKKS